MNIVRSSGRAVGIFLLGCGVVLLVWVFAFAGHSGQAFSVVERNVIYNVFDIGLGDFDGDGQLERWTVNHSAAQWLPTPIDGLPLHQDSGLPGFEPDGEMHDIDHPVWIHIDGADFVVEARHDGQISGRFRAPWTTMVLALDGAVAEKRDCVPEPGCTEVFFEVGAGQSVRMTPVPPPSDGFPVRFELDPEVDLASVAMGRFGETPPYHAFSYHSKDRHGLVLFEDFEDGERALFISRGGARGLLSGAHPYARDEFLVRSGDDWDDEADVRTLEKDGCPGRQAAAVDVNGDGRLDLYQVCGRSWGASDKAVNRLYIHQIDGRFREAAQEYGIAFAGSGSFRFLPGESGAPLRMLWAPADKLELLELGADNRFVSLWSVPRKGTDFDKIVVADIAGDAAPEILLLSRLGNLALPLAPEPPTPLSLSGLNLPEASSNGGVVDIDADGHADLLSIPQGIFLGSEQGFRKSDLLDISWIDPNRQEIRFGWFDGDGDGDLDLWLVTAGGQFYPRPLGGIYRRLPQSLQAGVERLVGRYPLERRYWLSEVYDNGLDHGRTRFVPGVAGGGIEIETVGPEGIRHALVSANRDDHSVFSDTLHGVFVTDRPPG